MLQQHPRATRWNAVVALIAAGMVSAFQIGKAAIAVPLLQDDLGISLVFASWIVGAFGALGAAFGLFAGGVASTFPPRSTLIAGLCTIGLASIAGAAAPNGMLLLATRVIEGCGFLAAVLSVPRLLRVVSQPADSDRVFALWGAYLPCGAALMMLLGPLFAKSWQFLWLTNGVIALAYAALIAFLPLPASDAAGKTGAAANVMRVITSPGALILALAFGIYTFHYFALTGLFPSLLVDQLGLSITTAGLISALTVLANGIGNLIAAVVLKRGIPLWLIAFGGYLVIGLSGFAIFTPGLPMPAIAIATAAALALTGFIPAAVYAAAPHISSNAALLAITIGLIMNGSSIGQLIGPASLAAFVQRFGWDKAPLLFVAVACAGLAVTFALRRILGEVNGPHNKTGGESPAG
jgi:predicted MFS family arabinose efflux permease